ncbi:MAG: Bax inhibitor-1/YccA family protein [Oscillospiraceae bacterium]|nr:Bax inhibitor-1/YccA family protein [Oscillospiraceae bacterium]
MTLTDSGSFIKRNPVLNRLGTIDDFEDSSERCTYIGIVKKLAIFLFSIVIGAFMEAIFSGTPLYMPFLVIFGIGFVIAPFLAIFIRKTIPVTGTLFCASTGFMIQLISSYSAQYKSAVQLSFLLTVLLVSTMAFFYGRGMIQTGQKFRTFMMVACTALIAGSLLVAIGSLIPSTSGFIAGLAANPGLSFVIAILMVVMGTLFLISDFDTITQCVEGGMPKDCEWYASFGLAFSVIWLYFKILQLVMKFSGRGRSGRR